MPEEHPRGEPGAILRPDRAQPLLDLARHGPRASLRPFVDYYWRVRWTVTAPHRQQVLPQPKIHVAAEHNRLLVHGVSRKPFERNFTTSGHVLGVAFRAGGFRPFLGSAVGALEGTVTPAADLLGPDDAPIARKILSGNDDETMVAELEDYLERCDPQPDDRIDEVAAIVERIERDTDVHRVDQAAALAGLSARSLQRLFTDYVGIAPKWVIQRRRLLDAAERAHSGEDVVWAELADRLGFSDQAHLVRAFTAAVGTPPATYARAVRTHEQACNPKHG